MTSILARLRQPFRALPNDHTPLPFVLNVIKLCAAVHLFTEHIGFITKTEGPSMLPTLNVHGDWVYISRLCRRGKNVQVGDMVSIKHPMFPGFSAGKRVLGMPGDFVMFNGGSGAGEDRMVQIPEGHCWMAGDNPYWSRDSNEYGPIPLALIKGRIAAKIWPLSERRLFDKGLQPVLS